MFSKFPGLRKTSRGLLVFVAVGVLLSCGSSYNSGGGGRGTSGLTLRAFVSNPVHPTSSGGGAPVLEIMDASKDLLPGFFVQLTSLSGSITDPGMMSVSPNHSFTVVMSPQDLKLAVIDNNTEAVSRTVTLPGISDSFFVWSDNRTGFAAVPNAAIVGQAPGAVEKIDFAAAAITATIPIPGAHYVVPSPNGNQILVFSDNVDTVVLLTPSLIGVAGQPTSISQCTSTQVPACILPAPPAALDRPIGAVFDPSGTTAYILNCGPECGSSKVGTTASVTVIDMTNAGNGAAVVLANQPLPGATVGLLQGTQLYIAGTQAGTAGALTVLNLSSGLSSVNCSTQLGCHTYPIADGYHTGMQMGANGQLFIGSKACVGLNSNGVCLSIFDSRKLQVVATPSNSPSGDVTGIAPIPNRTVVYVCQGGMLRVYDTTTDQLETFAAPFGQPDVIGQAVDVKVVDF